jgi:hypothetical protein
LLTRDFRAKYPISNLFGILNVIKSFLWHIVCFTIILATDNNGVKARIREESTTDSIGDFIKEIQHQIHEETRETCGDVAFERWLKPQYMGVMDNPDRYGDVASSCGDRTEVFLKFEEDRVKEASSRPPLVDVI